jgi:hypothetical protein
MRYRNGPRTLPCGTPAWIWGLGMLGRAKSDEEICFAERIGEGGSN